MSSLHSLRKRLQSVGRQRLLLDWLTAFLRLAIEACGVLLALFVIDFALRLESAARMIVLAVAAAFLLWRIYVRVRSLRAWPEGAVDIALLLERRQPLASDVVAGLQFDQSRLSLLGSEALAEQVAEQAACVESQLDYRSLIPLAQFRRQTLWAACVSAGMVTIALCFSAHSQAFAARLLLRDAAYPTRTRIVEIAINGKRLLDSHATARVVEGVPLSIAVRASGVLPDAGAVGIESLNGEDATVLALARSGEVGADSEAAYRVQGPPLKESVMLSVELGDARSDVIRVELVPRPIVELRIEATPPDYAQSTLAAETTQNRYVSFLAGSAISFKLRCTNGKQLRNAALDWSSESAKGTETFSPPEPGGSVWRLTPEAFPWRPLSEAVQFVVIIKDEDGLTTLQPLEGRIDVRSDQMPLGSLRTDHHLVVATALPIVRYEAADDLGLAELRLELSRERNGDESVVKVIELPLDDTAREASVVTAAGEAALRLGELELRSGDRLLVRLLATDNSGQLPSGRFTSDAVEFEIADEARVLRAILEADATADRLLTDAIEEESVLKEEK